MNKFLRVKHFRVMQSSALTVLFVPACVVGGRIIFSRLTDMYGHCPQHSTRSRVYVTVERPSVCPI